MRDNKPMKMKYSVLPSRMVEDKRFKIAHYNVMVCLGCHSGKSGLVYLTEQSIEKECPHIARETIRRALKDLVKWEYLHRLEPKFIKGQVSKWKTNRYMVVYSPDQPIPKYEELKKETVSVARMDADNQQEKVPNNQDWAVDRKQAETNLRMCIEGVNTASGIRPSYHLNELIQLTKDQAMPVNIDRHKIVVFTRAYLKKNRNQPPKLKELIAYVLTS